MTAMEIGGAPLPCILACDATEARGVSEEEDSMLGRVYPKAWLTHRVCAGLQEAERRDEMMLAGTTRRR